MYPLGQDLSLYWVSAHLSVHPSCILVDCKAVCRGYIQNVDVLDNSSWPCGRIFIHPFEKQSYHAMAMSVCSSVHANFQDFYFNILWDINLAITFVRVGFLKVFWAFFYMFWNIDLKLGVFSATNLALAGFPLTNIFGENMPSHY